MDDAEVAASLVTEAGALAARMLADGLDTHYKTSVSDVVSAADHAAEELVVARLTALRPDDGLVGEEGAARSSNGPSERTWFIDPVDGTYNFLSGLPYWCSAVGLTDDVGPLLGAVYYPARDELWVGGRDRPTTLNGVPVAPLVEEPLDRVSVATYLHPRNLRDEPRVATWRSAVGAAATVRMLGSASVDLAGVATGRIGVFLQANLHPWDWVPGAALVIGAGGATEVVELDGNRWQVAGNGRAVAETVAALRQVG
ncbi:MAG TPA: inositol monophosphatase family protein [Microlunatus sp.]